MRKTELLQRKIDNYNKISNLKLKLNNDGVQELNLYTEFNDFIATGKPAQIEMILDALLTTKRIEKGNN